MGLGNSYATFEEGTGYYEGEANLHIGGTIPRGTSLEFWLTIPRPRGINYDDWERIQQEKWDRIFGAKKDTPKDS